MKIILALLVAFPCLLLLARAEDVGDVVVRTRKPRSGSSLAVVHPGVAEDFVVRTPRVQAPEEIKAAGKELLELLEPKTPETLAEPVDVVRKAQKQPEALGSLQQQQEASTGFRWLPRFGSKLFEQGSEHSGFPDTGRKGGIIGSAIREIFAAGQVGESDAPVAAAAVGWGTPYRKPVVRSRKVPRAGLEQAEELLPILPKERPVGAISLVETSHLGELTEIPKEEGPTEQASIEKHTVGAAPLAAESMVVRTRPKRSGVSSQLSQQQIVTEAQQPADLETPVVDVVRTRAK